MVENKVFLTFLALVAGFAIIMGCTVEGTSSSTGIRTTEDGTGEAPEIEPVPYDPTNPYNLPYDPNDPLANPYYPFYNSYHPEPLENFFYGPMPRPGEALYYPDIRSLFPESYDHPWLGEEFAPLPFYIDAETERLVKQAWADWVDFGYPSPPKNPIIYATVEEYLEAVERGDVLTYNPYLSGIPEELGSYPGLDAETEKQIKQAWADWWFTRIGYYKNGELIRAGGNESNPYDWKNVYFNPGHYFGNYDGCVVVTLNSHYCCADDGFGIVLGSKLFCSVGNMVVWKDGRLYDARQAYKLGVLTDDMVTDMYERYPYHERGLPKMIWEGVRFLVDEKGSNYALFWPQWRDYDERLWPDN